MDYPAPLGRLIDELRRLPGIGPKSAQRIAFFLLRSSGEDNKRLGEALATIRDDIRTCEICYSFSDGERCQICADAGRNDHVICVVEEPRDVVAIERTQEFRGRYHVLQGAINPIEGIGPDQLRISELLARLGAEPVTEVILCTNPNIEGEATAMYLARLLQPLGIPVSRIASGLPVGGDLEYADELTLGRALEGRRSLDGG